MQVVIDISEKDYQNLKAKDKFDDMYLNYYEKLIVNGIPLPQNHGDLKDMDDLCPKSNYGCKNCDYLHTCNFYNTPTLIKADNGE